MTTEPHKSYSKPMGTCSFCGKRYPLVRGGVLPAHETPAHRTVVLGNVRRLAPSLGKFRCPRSGKPPAEQRVLV